MSGHVPSSLSICSHIFPTLQRNLRCPPLPPCSAAVTPLSSATVVLHLSPTHNVYTNNISNIVLNNNILYYPGFSEYCINEKAAPYYPTLAVDSIPRTIQGFQKFVFCWTTFGTLGWFEDAVTHTTK